MILYNDSLLYYSIYVPLTTNGDLNGGYSSFPVILKLLNHYQLQRVIWSLLKPGNSIRVFSACLCFLSLSDVVMNIGYICFIPLFKHIHGLFSSTHEKYKNMANYFNSQLCNTIGEDGKDDLLSTLVGILAIDCGQEPARSLRHGHPGMQNTGEIPQVMREGLQGRQGFGFHRTRLLQEVPIKTHNVTESSCLTHCV